MSEEFPSFQKEKINDDFQSRSSAFFFIVILVLLTGLSIFASFRFLSGSKTSRNEILARILEASESRQNHLLLEWMQHLNANEKDWTPTAKEQKDLLSWSGARVSDLKKTGNTPALLALHISSQGPGIDFDEELFKKLKEGAQTPDAKMALGLYLSRQKLSNEDIFTFFEDLSLDSSLILRKISLSYWENCLLLESDKKKSCEAKLQSLLESENDELRWSAAFSVVRVKQRVQSSLVQSAQGELRGLERKITTQDPELFSRFSPEILQEILKELKRHAL
jgi:hypothetical protein